MLLHSHNLSRLVEITDTNFLKLTSCHDEQSDDFWCCFSALHSQLLMEILWVTIYINKLCIVAFQFIHTTEVFGVLFCPYRLPLHLGHDMLPGLWWKPVPRWAYLCSCLPFRSQLPKGMLERSVLELVVTGPTLVFKTSVNLRCWCFHSSFRRIIPSNFCSEQASLVGFQIVRQDEKLRDPTHISIQIVRWY